MGMYFISKDLGWGSNIPVWKKFYVCLERGGKISKP